MTLYLVSPFAQDKEVTAYCFGKCGKVLCGAVTVAGSAFFPCRTNDCHYLADSLDIGEGEVLGKVQHIVVRKLQAAPQTGEA